MIKSKRNTRETKKEKKKELQFKMVVSATLIVEFSFLISKPPPSLEMTITVNGLQLENKAYNILGWLSTASVTVAYRVLIKDYHLWSLPKLFYVTI